MATGCIRNTSPLWLLFFVYCCVSVYIPLSHSRIIKRACVPHTAKPGFVVTSLTFWGQDFRINQESSRKDVPRHFAVLENGDVITTADISHLLGDSLSVVVENELGFEKWQDPLSVDVTDGSSMLVFSQPLYEGHILENQPPGVLVQDLENLKAEIADEDMIIHYSFTHGDTSEFELKIKKENGENIPRVVSKSYLDRESRNQYKFTLKAQILDSDIDPVFTELSIVVDDENDNIPVFDKKAYFVTLDEDVPSQTTISYVKATDADLGGVTYKMVDKSQIFHVDSKTGGIVLLSRPKLEPESYEFKVIAEDEDGSVSEPATVHIDVEIDSRLLYVARAQDHLRKKRDTFAIKELEIPESTVGSIIPLRSSSNQRFKFKEPAPEMLQIHPTNGQVRLKDDARFDYETMPEINFVVLITTVDSSSRPHEQRVRIRLTDVNDELPEFVNVPQPFLATVSTNAAPGSSVYQLMAQDADDDSMVRYYLESGGEDRFEVDAENGVVRTKGVQPFHLNKEYEIGVSAQDVKADTLQKSPTHSLKIYVGHREPQFFETHYTAQVEETASVGTEIVEIRAYSHQGFPINYELMAESGAQSTEFAINQHTGVVDLLRRLDYEKDMRRYYLKVKATELGRPQRTSTVNLIINLVDMNDNAPTFPLSQYIVHGIAETVSVGTDIIQVTATDLDSVTNSQLTYSVSDHNFTVQTLNNIGYIKTAKRLDYDLTNDHTYSFTVMATDNGDQPKSGSAMVRVTVTNVNDEDPIFTQSEEHVQVSEDATSNTVVHVIQAYDPDGDGVTYSFVGDKLRVGPFAIEPKSGMITLEEPLDKMKVRYHLNVTAVDNGQCCGGTTRRRSRGLVIVEVKDVNNNAPRFPDCNTYQPTVSENQDVGTSVIRVAATDLDTGANGNVAYHLVKSNDQSSDRFYIEPETGILRTADIFDREKQTGVTDFGVTVKAEDRGSPSLAGFCSFRVKIGDVNDNPPVFDLPEYETSIEENSIIGKRVLQVYATDQDAGDNGKVQYSILSDPSGFFYINEYTGWITVTSPMSGRNNVTLRVRARDLGDPDRKFTLVDVHIKITQTMNAYPQWVEDYSSTVIRVSENVEQDEIIKRLKAISSIPDQTVNYVIQPGKTAEQNNPRTFYYRTDDLSNEMLLLVYNKDLDYELMKKYTLTIKASNRASVSLHNETRITIELMDVNDEIPEFVGLDENGRYRGSVAENLRPGANVIAVTATDRDEDEDFSRITYKIKETGQDFDKFAINPMTGDITTKAFFDRERKSEYYITVVAEDGATSDRPNHMPHGTPNREETEVQIRITDKNDNAPYFKETMYKASIPENADIGAAVITVTAEDKDEENRLSYSITGGNVGNAFEVSSDVGAIKVRGRLDYEEGPREYRLTYRVFDEKETNKTTVIVQIMDVNDNPPKFDNVVYNVTDLVEEERSISRQHPKYLLTVRALDPDKERDSAVVYSLTGQFADDGTFVIDENSGEIFLTKPLDRDYPQGRPVWNFNVLAYDEPDSGQSLTGYAEVRVMPKDINDNAPVFDRNRLTGWVPEHSRAGMSVLTVIATDNDSGTNGTVTYSIKQAPMKGQTELFSIDRRSGLITTTMSNALDRESQPEYSLIVQATDRGSPAQSASATVLIKIDDINDHAPEFSQKLYKTTMSENCPKGASVTSVSATDKDIGLNAKLTYSLKESDRFFFYMTSVEATNTGVLKVFKPVDYDSLLNPFFNLTVYVQDSDTSHIDTAYIEVYVTDYNDNPPVFVPQSVHQIRVYENISMATTLTKFTATDKDIGINEEFTYSIDRRTDPDRQFAIDGNGVVTTIKPLDREKVDVHRLSILAIDKGTPAQTGEGTLIVTLLDVNDNPPEFAQDYRPVIYEDEPQGQTVVVIRAKDKDTSTNGPPFNFWLPCNGGCPCGDNPTCGYFGFEFKKDPTGKGGSIGIVTSQATFDREKKKEYYMPIIMSDDGRPPMTGTNTLTIIIGDKNDNKHYPGHKNITVYNYKGLFHNATLGNVYAADEDDWDVVDKTFTFVDTENTDRFALDKNSGMLSLNGTVTEGVYRFKVKVDDRTQDRWVISTVAVFVKEIGDDAVTNSGSLRLRGITAEEFVDKPPNGVSRYDQLRTSIANKLGVPETNVDIFTVMNHPTMPDTIDIRYSAHGSPYYRPARLDGIINQYKEEFEEELGLKILMVPIDECLKEECESGGCANVLKTTANPLLVNTNSTSLIGVTSYIEAECVCKARNFDNQEDMECSPDKCYNGGYCERQPGGYRCRCLPGFDGPRCQQTHHSFNGNGWAWFKPLAQCENSHTSLEFLTSSPDGLLLYNGPIRELEGDEATDFILLELKKGYPRLRIDHGSSEMVPLAIDGKDRHGQQVLAPLNDGTWHRIDIFREGKRVRLVVDRCESATIRENENSQASQEDGRLCEAEGETPGRHKYINVNTPLELGGRSNPYVSYPRDIMEKGFDGCIKNLIHDGELYDLHIGRVGEHANTEDGCFIEDVVCGVNDLGGPHCGQNGTCIGSLIDEYECVCDAGWRGPKCSIPTTTKDFKKDSFLEWDFKDDFYAELEKSLHRGDLQLMFRTTQDSGLLLKAQNAQKSEYLTLEVVDRKVRFRYNLGSGEQSVMLSYFNVSDGQFHTVTIERVGQWVTMKVDGGEGRLFNESLGVSGGHLNIRISQSSLFAGGDVRFPSSDAPPLVDHDFRDSCMNDVRFNNEWFPMDRSQNRESRAADLAQSANLEDGCESNACASITCIPPLVCVDLWRKAVCNCPPGQKMGSHPSVCVNINECKSNPCLNGECIDSDYGFMCKCYDGYTGELCMAQAAQAVAYVSMGMVVVIVICALILLLVILLFVIYSRQRRRPVSYVVGVDPDDDVRENIINYDEEGVGEEDQDAYDINRLKKPVDEPTLKSRPPVKEVIPPPVKEKPRKRAPPPRSGQPPDVGDFIKNRLDDADHDPSAPPHDSVREYAYEGAGSDAGSLSSLASTNEGEQNYDYLNDWGPRFSKLADMYGGPEAR